MPRHAAPRPRIRDRFRRNYPEQAPPEPPTAPEPPPVPTAAPDADAARTGVMPRVDQAREPELATPAMPAAALDGGPASNRAELDVRIDSTTDGPGASRPVLRVLEGRRASRVTVETAEDVTILYPNGVRIPVNWTLDPSSIGAGARRFVAEVSPAASLQPGMTIRAGGVSIPVVLQPNSDDWVVGGAGR